jgi:hypothetical protein
MGSSSIDFRARQWAGDTQILDSGQIILDAACMAEISHRAKVDSAEGANFRTIPADFTMSGGCEPTEHAQKAGFTAAIGALHLHEPTRFEGEIDIFK